jgi:hypothetical protein
LPEKTKAALFSCYSQDVLLGVVDGPIRLGLHAYPVPVTPDPRIEAEQSMVRQALIPLPALVTNSLISRQNPNPR